VTQRRLDLKVGFACNNHCVFCAQGDKRTRSKAFAGRDLAQKLLSARDTTVGLVLTGGEPSMHRDILTLVRLAARLGYSPIQLQTNGRMLSQPRVLQAFLDAGVTEIAPSLHGPTPEIHDALTRTPGSFAQSTRGIQNAIRAQVPVITNSVITKGNVEHLSELVSLLADLGVRQAQLALVHPVGSAQDLFEDVVPRLETVSAALVGAWRVARSAGIRLVTEAVPLCFLRGMTDLAVEAAIPPTTVIDLEGVVDYSDWRVSEGKAKGPPCVSCTERERCEGPWREYPQAFGWAEFRPLLAS
jgi:MoaA/NifB/PqqE/SkfB family radical SAM enzyme